MTQTALADLFLLCIGAAFALLYQWLFRILPRARWQFIAVLPLGRDAQGHWRGRNLTFYGFFTACAGAIAVATFILLTSAVGADLGLTLLLTVVVLALCLPAAKLIAVVVEKNRHGFTVGGASFVGIIVAPILLWWLDTRAQAWFGTSLPVLPMLAAMAIAYVIGEGVGRLACISFGCCYGKAVDESPATLRALAQRYAQVFEGETKKIAFAGGMEGRAVIPIQAITCALYTLLAIACAILFFHQQFELAFGIALVGSQLWRLYSETLRADYRGGSKQISAYQVMALIACGWGIGITLALPMHTGMAADLGAGLAGLWHPGVLIALQGIWAVMFVFSGSSTITTSTLRFGLAPDWRCQAGCEHPPASQPLAPPRY